MTTTAGARRWHEWTEIYVAELVAAGLATGTIKNRRGAVGVLSDAFDDPLTVSKHDLVVWLAERSRYQVPSTIAHYVVTMRGFFACAAEHGLRTDDPAARLRVPKLPTRLPRPAPEDAVQRGLASENRHARLAVRVGVETGFRAAEIARVHADDVLDLDGEKWLRTIGKGCRERVVPISDVLAELIVREAAATGWLFPSWQSGRTHLSPAYVADLVKAAMGGIVTHRLRHRYGTLAYRGSRDLRAVQELLGHASVATTQSYTRVDADSKRAAARFAALPTTDTDS